LIPAPAAEPTGPDGRGGTAPLAMPSFADDRARLVADPDRAGVQLCRDLSDLTDSWLAGLFAAGGAPAGTALVAVGGYGRRELSPQSDLDVLLLHERGLAVSDLADRIWYPVWDAGLKLGHAVRTTREALALASDDLDTATSLLSARPIAGDAALVTDLRERALALWRKRSKRWLAEINQRVRDRHRAQGEVAFLLEPDLKEGRGGLRDVHAIRWAELAQSVMIEGDDTLLESSYQTLLAARVELHRRTHRHGDVLLLQEQDAVAETLGLGSADRLMRDVSTAARAIAWTSDELWDRIESSLTGPSSIRLRRDRPLAPGVVLREGTVQLTADAQLDDPLLVLRVAVAAALASARIERRSLDRLALVAAGLPDPYPWTREARHLFADLFMAGRPAIAVIEAYDHKGIWERLLPEWSTVRCKPQRNAYHTFTVDRHLCEAAVNASELIDRVDRPDLLVVGTLLHDIGKGFPGDHTEVGIDKVAAIGDRMGYAADDTALLVAMVRHHLLLPEVATRRDLSDDGTIDMAAKAVGDERTLRLLAALSEADSKATGPAFWNNWRSELLAQLVDKVTHVLGGGSLTDVTVDTFPTPDQRARMAEGHQVIDTAGNRLVLITRDRPGLFSRVAGVLSLCGLDVLDAAVHSDEAGMALEMFTVTPRAGSSTAIPWDRVVRDLELALTGRLALSARIQERARLYDRPRLLPYGPVEPSVKVDTELSRTATVIEVHVPDSVGVLYRITRGIAEIELDIRSAKVQTMGYEAIDSFYVRHPDGSKPTDPALIAELERAILHSLNT
jgi:[protein-PII] uridylyltransferase